MPDYKNREEFIKQAKQRMVKGATAKFKMPKSFPSKGGAIAPKKVKGSMESIGRDEYLRRFLSRTMFPGSVELKGLKSLRRRKLTKKPESSRD
jgi:hypothetical protein